jgi:4a-hydroxytetrahydrobiopterin dehydratase
MKLLQRSLILLLRPSSYNNPPYNNPPYFLHMSTNTGSEGEATSETAAAPQACVPCSTLTDASFLLPLDDLPALTSTRLPLWKLAADATFISRTFVARHFQAVLEVVNAMGAIAEEQGHHPDFHWTNYRELQIVVATHKLGGLTENDFVLAALLDKVPVDYSPKWLRAHPEAQS